MAAAGVLQAPPPGYNLAIWHGFNVPFTMSLAALLGGVLIYAGRGPLFVLATRWQGRLDARAFYDWTLSRALAIAGWLTRRLETASLQRMLLLLILSALILGAAGFIGGGSALTGTRAPLPINAVALLLTLGMVAAVIGTLLMHRRRFTALIVMGALGLLISLIFVQFSAPDLALTQLTVEVVTIVLLLLALYFLPQHSPVESTRTSRLRDLGVATLAGAGAAALTWAILTRPFESISEYFLANSVLGGGGTNVVNVILVDFRGFDTLGEISVLALAGLGIYAMLRDLRLQGPTYDAEGRPWNWDMHPSIMAALTRLLLPLVLLVSVFIFLRGHNLPGGGFIAGLITAVGLIMQYLTNGAEWTHSRMPNNMHPVIGAGLLIGLITGLTSLALGYPFLTSTFTHVHWPIVGDFELASAMAFDLGVYLVVVGATLLILIHLGLIHRASHPTSSNQLEPR